MRSLREELEQQTNVFVDAVMDGLKEDMDVFESVVDWDWQAKSKVLMLRVESKDPERFHETRTRVVELIRDMGLKLRFNAHAAIVKVKGSPNILLKLTPAPKETGRRRQKTQPA